MTTTSNRIQYIDAAKGLGMILIIFGHSIHDGFLNNWIHSFHVPMFFLISGFFLNPEVEILDFIRKKWKHIGNPLLLTHLFCFVVLGTIFYYSSRQNPYHVKWIVGQLLYLKDTLPVIWFLYALFWGQIIVFFLIKYCKCYHILLSLLLFVLADRASEYAEILPLCVVQGISSVSFISLGYELRNHGLLLVKIPNWALCVCFFLLLFACKVPVYMSKTFFPLGIWNVLLSSWLSYIVLLLFYTWSNIKTDSTNCFLWKLLCHFGRYSLVIMCFHCIEMTCQFDKLFGKTIVCSICFWGIRMLILCIVPILVLRIPLLRKFFVIQ